MTDNQVNDAKTDDNGTDFNGFCIEQGKRPFDVIINSWDASSTPADKIPDSAIVLAPDIDDLFANDILGCDISKKFLIF